MADIFEIEDALVATIADGFGLGENYSPTTFANSSVIVGDSVVVMSVGRGMPVSGDLEPAIKAGKAVITIFPEPNWSRPSAIRLGNTKIVETTPITINTVVSADSVTFSGTGTPGQVVGLGWNHTGFALRLTASETSQEIAEAFQAMISGSSVSGSTVTLPTAANVFADVVGDSTSQEEISRQCQCFKLTIWAPNHRVRDAIGKKLTQVMAGQRSLTLVDGAVTGKPLFRGVVVEDQTQKSGVWKRSERYEIEYATVLEEQVPGFLFFGLNTNVDVAFGYFHPDGPYSE